MELKRILLIDDEEDIRRVASISLEKIGKFELVTAASGEEGIAVASREMPDLIILDMMMPGMDGFTTIARLKETEGVSNIPVIFMTAKTQLTEKSDFIASGACGVIEKPFDPMTLSDEVRRIADSL